MRGLPFLIVELGTRIACGACGSLLAQLGATVAFVEAEPARAEQGKFAHRLAFVADKLSVEPDEQRLRELIVAADVVLVSSDIDPPWIAELLSLSAGPTVCDVTAFGRTGPLAGRPFSDGLVQAIAGIMETTGRPDGPPRAVAVPVLEYSTALYAAAAIIASLGAGTRGELIDMALYDCAVSALTTFLPAHFGGGRPGRLGNRHSMAAPWNAYRARDGWVLICATDDRQWQRICTVIGRGELVSDPDFATLKARMAHRDLVDTTVEGWTVGRTVVDAVAALAAEGVACGPIVPARALAEEANLQHRRMVREIAVPGGGTMRVPGPLIRFDRGPAPAGPVVPRRGEGWEFLGRHFSKRTPPAPAHSGLPLAGIRVVEIGQYTTAPLAGRHLAMLGADVVKIEPPDGDPARLWAPHRDGLSYFFVLSNSGKKSVSVDLRSPTGADYLARLLEESDVLIENMKPGSLARLGFGRERLRAINPRLIYCAVSGFGADAAYPQRPAFDTVVQAMSGVMDLTRDGDLPLKVGVSVADICGGELALVAVLAALEIRKATGRGLHADLAMQDVAAWLTQLAWNGPPATRALRAVECGDGFVAIDVETVSPRVDLTRGALLEWLSAQGVDAAPVQTIREVVEHPQTAARCLIVTAAAADGTDWPLLRSPLRFSVTPTRVGVPIGSPQPWAIATEG